MSRSAAPAAPLEADDPERARWLKAKIRDRVSDVRRHLVALRELRRLLVHEYATATAGQVHEAAGIVADEFAPFYDAYRVWSGRGFSA